MRMKIQGTVGLKSGGSHTGSIQYIPRSTSNPPRSRLPAPTGTTYVPAGAAQCKKCTSTSSNRACRKCPDTTVIGAEKGIEFHIAGEKVYELGPDSVRHSLDMVLEGDVLLGPEASLTASLGTVSTFDAIQANTAFLAGAAGGIPDTLVTKGNVLFQNGPLPEGEDVNTVMVDGPKFVVDGNAEVTGVASLVGAKIGRVSFKYQGNDFGPLSLPMGDYTPVRLFGDLVCDETTIGAMAAGWATALDDFVPLKGLIPGDPQNGYPYTDFRKGSYVLMFCAPTNTDYYAEPAGWVVFPGKNIV